MSFMDELKKIIHPYDDEDYDYEEEELTPASKPAKESFREERREVRFHDVREHYLHVVEFREGLLQDRLQGGVYLHRDDLFAARRQLLGENSHAGAYLQGAHPGLRAAHLGYLRAHRRVYQEVLPERFREGESVPLEQLPYNVDIRQLHQ